jgi:heme-degrading monooxygenase HmoA
MIYVHFAPEQAQLAQRNWKDKCAPLMIRQPGCLSEELLQCTDDPGGLISYSEWDKEESIEKYLQSDDHQEIKQHNRNISGAQVTVKHYQMVS